MFVETGEFMFMYGYIIKVTDVLNDSCLYCLDIFCLCIDILLLLYDRVYVMVELVLKRPQSWQEYIVLKKELVKTVVFNSEHDHIKLGMYKSIKKNENHFKQMHIAWNDKKITECPVVRTTSFKLTTNI